MDLATGRPGGGATDPDPGAGHPPDALAGRRSPPVAPTSGGSAGAPIEPRQRWQLEFRRWAASAEITQRDLGAALDDALARSGLPLVPGGRYRSRVTFALPLPFGVEGEREPAELYLAERTPVYRVRDALAAGLPAGFELVDLFDVWLGEPSLIGRVTGAVYRVELGGEVDQGALAGAARAILGAASLPREKQKGSGIVRYDLRPLLGDIIVPPVPHGRERAAAWITVRIHPEHGSGRPREVVAALEGELGRPLEITRIVRERVLLAGG